MSRRTSAFFIASAACGQDYGVSVEKARAELTPAFKDLGQVEVGSEVGFELSLASVTGEIGVLSVDVQNGEGEYFAHDGGELPTVESDGSAALGFVYAPGWEGTHWARILVTTDEDRDGPHEAVVRGFGGLGVARAWPAVVDFGPVAPGESAVASITVANESGLDLLLTELAFDAAVFGTSENLPLAVLIGDEREIELTFAPEDDLEATGEVALALGSAEVAPILLRGNACSTASGDLYDRDDDGFGWCGADCDDADGGAHPGAVEVCDGVDQDCDGAADDGTSCYDDDGDGATEDDGDCDDNDDAIGPGATEEPDNGVDDDCDGVVDLGALDADGDGWSLDGGDCDDEDGSLHPGAEETADGVDQDCDSRVDEGTSAWDDDGDGWSEDDGDCDDGDTSVYPSASEEADWTDDDCDGTVDEGTENFDDDGDGFSEIGLDCDDADDSVNPGEPEVDGNGIDDDCDGTAR